MSVIDYQNIHHLYVINMDDEEFKKYVNLKSLFVENNSITNEGIKSLVNLKKLKLINCNGITNEGIKNLTNLKKLKLINCNNIDVNNLRLYYFRNVNNRKELKTKYTTQIRNL